MVLANLAIGVQPMYMQVAVFSAISCVHVNAYAHRALCFLPFLVCTRMLVRTVHFALCKYDYR